jgi:hypothetical protein
MRDGIVVIDTEGGVVKSVFGNVPAQIAILDMDLQNSKGLPRISLDDRSSACVYHNYFGKQSISATCLGLVHTIERNLGMFINLCPAFDRNPVETAQKPATIIVEVHAGHIKRAYSDLQVHLVVLSHGSREDDCILSINEQSFKRDVRWYQHLLASDNCREMTFRLQVIKKYLSGTLPMTGKQRKNKFLAARPLPDPGPEERALFSERGYRNMLRSSRGVQFCRNKGETIQDFLNDMMHLCDALDISFEELLKQAASNYRMEFSDDGWGEF